MKFFSKKTKQKTILLEQFHFWNCKKKMCEKYSKNSMEIAGLVLDIITEEVNMIYPNWLKHLIYQTNLH